MNFERQPSENIPKHKEVRTDNKLKQEKSLALKRIGKKTSALALGAFLSVAASEGFAKGGEVGMEEKSKRETVEKTTPERAALQSILKKIMEQKLSDDAPMIEKNKKQRLAAIHLTVFMESQSNKKAAVRALEESLQDTDIRDDKELAATIKRIIDVYKNIP
ncbi:MAG: hypothetical protein HYT98_03985 [Candidatus Sungbacteria bacterium]|nr:hypothetical protein [Candidatus Sungbacteria bacterium]